MGRGLTIAHFPPLTHILPVALEGPGRCQAASRPVALAVGRQISLVFLKRRTGLFDAKRRVCRTCNVCTWLGPSRRRGRDGFAIHGGGPMARLLGAGVLFVAMVLAPGCRVPECLRLHRNPPCRDDCNGADRACEGGPAAARCRCAPCRCNCNACHCDGKFSKCCCNTCRGDGNGCGCGAPSCGASDPGDSPKMDPAAPPPPPPLRRPAIITPAEAGAGPSNGPNGTDWPPPTKRGE
jgi:hypothetical protein